MSVVRIVCPHCREQSDCEVGTLGLKAMSCTACGNAFETLFGEVRAKRSRGSRRTDNREFDVRVDTGRRERMVRFVAPGYGDMELRSGDLAAFSYIDGALHIVHNFTIGEHAAVRPAPLSRVARIAIAVAVAAALAGTVVLLARS